MQQTQVEPRTSTVGTTVHDGRPRAGRELSVEPDGFVQLGESRYPAQLAALVEDLEFVGAFGVPL